MTDSANTVHTAPEIDLFGNSAQPTPGRQITGEPIVPAFPNESWTKTKSLEELDNAINTCMKMRAWKNENQICFGVGNPKGRCGRRMVEAPGADEDEKGRTVCRRAGQLLNKDSRSSSI